VSENVEMKEESPVKEQEVKEELKINENQWQCERCTFINDIDWESILSPRCQICGFKNELISELIMERNQAIKCTKCRTLKVNDECPKCSRRMRVDEP
jgi:hypothetical protein